MDLPKVLIIILKHLEECVITLETLKDLLLE